MSSKVSEQPVEVLEVIREIEIAAPIDIVFETVLENMGRLNAGSVAWRPLVSGFRQQQRVLVGNRPIYQATRAAGTAWTDVYVGACGLECAVPAEGRERADAHRLLPSRGGTDSASPDGWRGCE
jgi:hypothetical protein